MTVPIYIIAAFVSISTAFSADYFRDRHYHITVSFLVALVASITAAVVLDPHVRYAMLCFLAAGTWSATPLILTWTANTISYPNEKRAIAIALVNAIGNTASVYGSRIWPSNNAPEYYIGFGVTAAFVGAGMVIAFLAGFAFKRWSNIHYRNSGRSVHSSSELNT